MFGVELIAAVLGLGAIALAYFVFNFFLREKTFEEALAEQRGDAAASDLAKGQRKDKSKKPKKKVAASETGSDVSPKAPVKKPSAESAASTSGPAVTGKKSEKKYSDSESNNTDGDQPKPRPAPVRKPKEVQPVRVSKKTSESDKERKQPVSNPSSAVLQPPLIFRETDKEKKQAFTSTAKNVSISDKENREETVGQDRAVRKPNVVQLELVQAGHTDAVANPVPRKDAKPAHSDVSGKNSAPKPAKQQTVAQKEVSAPKKPLSVVSGNLHAHQTGLSEYSEVLGLLKTVQLSDAETQNLLQVLIVKQSEKNTEWVQLAKGKTTDPATIAKKLIVGKEQELHDEKQMNKALQDQLKDMKNLLAQEKIRLREISDTHSQSAVQTSTLEHQLKTVSQRLKDSQDKHAMDIAQLTRRVNDAEGRAATVIVQQQHKTTAVADDTEQLTRELESVRNLRDQLAEQLQASLKKIKVLEERNNLQIQTETHVRSAETTESEEEIRSVKQQLEQAQEKERMAFQARASLEKELAKVSGALAKSEDEIKGLVTQLEQSQSSFSDLKHINETLSHNLTVQKESVKQDQEDSSNEESILRTEVQQLKTTIKDLKDQETKLRDETQRVRVDGYEEAQTYFEPQISETRDRHREVIQRLFPSIHVAESLNSGEWLQEFEKAALGTVHHKEDQHAREEADVKKTQADLDRSRVTLAETEKKLAELQNSVESEEDRWEVVEKTAKEHETKCRTLETQLSEVLDEKNSVQRLLEERATSVDEVELRLQEAEERLRAFASVQQQLDGLREEADRLKSDLGDTRREKDSLLEESNKLRSSLGETTTALSTAEERASTYHHELNELKNKSDGLENLHREAVDLRRELDAEKDNARKMAQELLRSRSLITVGLESLRKEEETVTKLKEALESREHGLNGSIGPGGDHIGNSHHYDHTRGDDRQVSSAQ